MDFSNSAFRTAPASNVSNDTISHANLVMSCRWGWTSTPDEGANSPFATSSTQPIPTSTLHNVRSKRFAPCQGRLYHQLLCSHRIRTDLVEDCGTNCVEPYGNAHEAAFMCNECIQAETANIWEERQAQHNAAYPPMEQMAKEQYDQWYAEHRQLEEEFARHQRLYEMELKAKMRPSNICSALEATTEEMDFATELDSLSLSLMASNTSTTDSAQLQPHGRTRTSLATDPSEQLHWNLNTLALDRGSCGIEYSASQPSNDVSSSRQLDPDELWRKPRN
ncbi:pantothenate transporter liz1 [Pyrenophora seminiperda CCB06]|uniref:Pantothenate transporter liz1 n=1 Tax=Pyrenophora seminiperda CCB06 TaxID=1302712 RepID=A0A3M7M294_9PLEO|nr:pantothenate transporter liz1 [Pyrenophora seminiperda CCB06]